jgi:hypothetical protein
MADAERTVGIRCPSVVPSAGMVSWTLGAFRSDNDPPTGHGIFSKFSHRGELLKGDVLLITAFFGREPFGHKIKFR